jgi:hypothetical protein
MGCYYVDACIYLQLWKKEEDNLLLQLSKDYSVVAKRPEEL